MLRQHQCHHHQSEQYLLKPEPQSGKSICRKRTGDQIADHAKDGDQNGIPEIGTESHPAVGLPANLIVLQGKVLRDQPQVLEDIAFRFEGACKHPKKGI